MGCGSEGSEVGRIWIRFVPLVALCWAEVTVREKAMGTDWTGSRLKTSLTGRSWFSEGSFSKPEWGSHPLLELLNQQLWDRHLSFSSDKYSILLLGAGVQGAPQSRSAATHLLYLMNPGKGFTLTINPPR